MNIPALKALAEHIVEFPEAYIQEHWIGSTEGRCGTTACLAGTVCLMMGAEDMG